MKKLEDFLFVPFNGKFFRPPKYVGDCYLEVTTTVRELILHHADLMKPICLVVPDETFNAIAQTSGFTVERDELGVFITSYHLLMRDTRVTCEKFLIDPIVTTDVCRQLEVAFEVIYDRPSP